MFPRFDNLIPEQLNQIASALHDCGWLKPHRAAEYLLELRRLWEESNGAVESSPEWYEVLGRVLQGSMSPGLTLESTCEFVRATRSVEDAFALFADSPRSLDILGRFSSGSPFLTQVLLRDPDVLSFLTRHRRISELKSREEFCEEAQQFLKDDPRPVLVKLRLYQRREQLRIGMCDVFGLLSLQLVTLQLSLLADAMVRLCLEMAMTDAGVNEPPFAVLALGKHGGEELNYSSDIDLALVGEALSRQSQSVARRMVEGLSDHLESGFLYRVDLRLRPWGQAGPLLTTTESWFKYLTNDAQLWEKQALLKARFVTGDAAVAERMLSTLPPMLFSESADSIRSSIRLMKDRIEASLRRRGRNDTEVKLGSGSIRDVEFLVQSLQLIHGAREPRVASANTMDALVRLADFGLLPAAEFQQLRDGYVFLRSIEHALQLQHNRQTHEIPQQPELREWLALRVDYPDAATFISRFDEHRQVIRRVFNRSFRGDVVKRMPVAVADISATSENSEGTTESRPDSSEIKASSELQQLLISAEESQSVALDLIVIDGRQAIVLICMPDEPELLTLVSGVLFSAGLDIRRGSVTTGPGRLGDLSIPAGMFAASFCVESRSTDVVPGELLRLIRDQIGHLILTNHRQGIGALRQKLIALFCLRMEATPCPNQAMSGVKIVDRPASDLCATVVTISSADNPGFLFELSNALNLCRFRIRSARIDTDGDQVHDELRITEVECQEPLSPARVQEILTAVILIQQFTLWLPSSADPGPVLLRFRRLLQTLLLGSAHAEIALVLRNPDVLKRVARVLGLSRHLWEDALQHESYLIPFLAVPEMLSCPADASALRQEAQIALQQSGDDSQRSDAAEVLNLFKDRHLFRVELRHVLGHCRAFGEFSREITTLAEVSLEIAAEIALRELSERNDATDPVPLCPWTLVGLGKFGGIEMGYGSDIELLLIYDSPDHRCVGRWFARLLAKISEIVASRHDGIFEIDLRMRPWGQAGSAAVSLEQFESYYSRTGNAWPYERQALIKMRSFGPDSAFGQRLAAMRDRLVYDDRPFDFTAMNGLREQQVRQHVQPGSIHAKLSKDCLVDIEYSVQALQLTFGWLHAELRTANTLGALDAARRVMLLPEELWQASQNAYVYFRQLIDCLRMVRGNAKDLKIPLEGSPDRDQLERRLAQIYTNKVSLSGLAHHRAAVNQLMACVWNRCGASGSAAIEE